MRTLHKDIIRELREKNNSIVLLRGQGKYKKEINQMISDLKEYMVETVGEEEEYIDAEVFATGRRILKNIRELDEYGEYYDD